MKIQHVTRWILSVLGCLMFSAHAQAADITGTVKVCGDGAGWPPYHFDKDGTKAGYDLDVLDAALKTNGVEYSFEMPPWARCLAGLESGKYHMAVSSSFSEERNTKFLLTEHYYVLNPYYFYSKTVNPEGFNASTIDDLKKHTICGLRGYNYAGFGFTNEDIDRGTGSFDQLVQKLGAKRCDMFVARFQIIKGFDVIGKPVLTPDVAYAPIPGIEGDKFFMLISRKYDQNENLKKMLDSNFSSLRASGKLDELLKKYL
jgi:polar amino acid transport system substrate-binding protein